MYNYLLKDTPMMSIHVYHSNTVQVPECNAHYLPILSFIGNVYALYITDHIDMVCKHVQWFCMCMPLFVFMSHNTSSPI